LEIHLWVDQGVPTLGSLGNCWPFSRIIHICIPKINGSFHSHFRLIYLFNKYLIWSFWVSCYNACINVKLQIQPWVAPTLSYINLILLFHYPLFDFDQNIYQRVLNAYILNWMVGLVILFMNEYIWLDLKLNFWIEWF
jgi:hypothetical protein